MRQPFFLLDAGESAAFQDLDFVTLTSFATASFYGTSGGVMPIGAYPNSIWFAESSANPSGTVMKSSPTTVIYAQQGLTASARYTSNKKVNFYQKAVKNVRLPACEPERRCEDQILR